MLLKTGGNSRWAERILKQGGWVGRMTHEDRGLCVLAIENDAKRQDEAGNGDEAKVLRKASEALATGDEAGMRSSGADVAGSLTRASKRAQRIGHILLSSRFAELAKLAGGGTGYERSDEQAQQPTGKR